jgi:Phytanoyl-CoA dioxygenase (PhyH)
VRRVSAGELTDLGQGIGFEEADLTGIQRTTLEDMRRDGIATVPFSDLFDEQVWNELKADIDEFAAATERNLPELMKREDGKTFLARRFYVRETDGEGRKWWTFPIDDRWLRLGLASPILDVVNAYRGRPMQLIDLDNWYTIPDPEAIDRVRSQQWHRDPWDNHIVKVFIYFNDVGEDAGPFEYVPESPEGSRYGHLWPWEPKGIYPPQDEFAQAIPPAEWRSITGPAGTIIFCDTSGFHRGGWAQTNPRILSYHSYVSTDTRKPPRIRVDWSGGGRELTPEAEFAIAWSHRKKYAVGA